MSRLAPPEASTSLVDYISDAVQEMILSGALSPGEPVNINAIAKQTAVSLVPVREALARLSAKGLLTFLPNRGYRVSPPLDDASRASLFQAREVLEVAAAPLAVEHRTSADVRSLRRLNASMKALDGEVQKDRQTFFRLNDQFHRVYLGMSKNLYLVKMFETLAFDLLMSREPAAPIDVPRLTREHEIIIDAIEARDAEALKKLLIRHIRSTL